MSRGEFNLKRGRRAGSLLAAGVLALLTAHARAIPFGATQGDTSLYGLGTYVHNVVFLQDDLLRDPDDILHPEDPTGTVIHFTEDELLAQRQHILDAADFWNNHPINQGFHPGARLNITVNFVNAGQPFTVADAGTPMGIDADIAGYADALAQIDPAYAGLSANPAARQFSHDTRVAAGADFAWTTFVRPLEPRTASAGLNGPNINAYLDSNTFVHAHEAAHIFGALDEYAPNNTNGHGGYLDVFNLNAELLPDGSPNPDHVPSIMSTFGLFNLSEPTIAQIGWRDTDADSIPDILDTLPRLFSNPSNPDPFAGVSVDLNAGTVTANLIAVVTPVESPSSQFPDATINTLERLQYRLERGTWIDLLPSDGTLGDALETYTLALTDLAPLTADGGLILDLRLTNSVGNTLNLTHTFGVPEPATITTLLPLLALSTTRTRRRVRA